METDVAAEAYRILYKQGSEHPHVYVNAGPNPRVHSEPFKDNILRENTFITNSLISLTSWRKSTLGTG